VDERLLHASSSGRGRSGDGEAPVVRRAWLSRAGFASCFAPITIRPVGNGLVETEIVHLFSGDYGGSVEPNRHEVEDVAWRSHEFLLKDLAARPEAYTCWFNHYMREFGDRLFKRPDGALPNQVPR
jgi:hypothetical protein